MDIKNTFAKQFGEIAQRSNKAGFEVRFNAVQRGLLGQMNEKISEVNQNSVEREVARLQKKRDDLVAKSDDMRNLQFDMKTNALRFLEIRDAANAAVTAADADEDGSLSDEEVVALNSSIAEIKEEVFKLKFTYQYPEFSDSNLANRMRQQIVELEELTAVNGVVDDDVETGTNDNRAILGKLEDIGNQSNIFADTATVLVGSLNQLIIDSNKKAFDVEADVANLTTGELARREDEISEIQTRYGNLIRSISLAFEVQSGYADALAAGTQYEPEKGSILNIFT